MKRAKKAFYQYIYIYILLSFKKKKLHNFAKKKKKNQKHFLISISLVKVGTYIFIIYVRVCHELSLKKLSGLNQLTNGVLDKKTIKKYIISYIIKITKKSFLHD